MKRILLSVMIAMSSLAMFSQSSIVSFMQSPDAKTSSTPYGNNIAVGKYVKADDANIYYEVYGEGQPIVVLHGGGVGCTYEMNQFIDSLRVDHKVIAISTRGHGRSEIGSKPVTYEQKANDVKAVIDAVTKEPVEVLGFSDGAYSAYKLAEMYPDAVKKIVAIGAGEIIPGLRQIILNIDAMAQYDAKFIEQQKRMMPEPKRWQEYWDDYAGFYNRVTISKNIFNNIKCPVLLVVGELDQNAPLATVMAAYQQIPNAQLAVIANAPHQAFMVNFDAVWANVKPFLNSRQ
jgi:pimeloyl-ACP methyl ester carboxylesterase